MDWMWKVRERKIEDDFQVFSLRNWVESGVIYGDWKDQGKSGFRMRMERILVFFSYVCIR